MTRQHPARTDDPSASIFHRPRWPLGALAMLLLAACSPDPAPVTQADNAADPPPAGPSPIANAAATASAAPPAVPAAAAPVLAVEGEGLRLFDRDSGRARPIPFGTARDAALGMLAFRGPPETGRQSECGAGPLDYAAWPDGLKLYFQQDRLTGWALDQRASRGLTTAAGVGPGSSRAELEAAYAIKVMQSSLGTEFTAGDIAGLLDGAGRNATISAMWAGTSCIFR